MATAACPATAYDSSPPYAFLLLAVVSMILVVPCLFPEQSSLFEMANTINPSINSVMIMAAPLVLIFIIRWLSSSNNNNADRVSGGGDPSSVKRAGGSPVGVAIVLLIVLLMVWHQSSGVDDEPECKS